MTNKSYNCGENKEADRLLCMLEANSVLSDSFNQKVTNIVLVIITNLDKNEDWVDTEIKKLKDEMNWLEIFSSKFIGTLIGQLVLSYHRQLTINKGK